MAVKYILRCDDLTPQMNWENFLRLKSVLEKYNIKSVLGIVPDNKDKDLNITEGISNDEFFSRIRVFKEYGDTITQHGVYHIMDSEDSGYMRLNNYGEFAGHSYDVQYQKLKEGKDILVANRVWEPYFMAPAHSFDKVTLQALKSHGFKALTDGYGFYPYLKEDLLLVPQLFASPISKLNIGYQTICLHTNNMTTDSIDGLISFIVNNHKQFVDFKEVVLLPINQGFFNSLYRIGTRYGLKVIRQLRKII